MTLAALALLAADAHAGDFIQIDVETETVCAHDHDHGADEAPPVASVTGPDHHDDRLWLGYGMQFTPEAPAHHLAGRLVGERDAYVSAELRYLPMSEVMWTGRVGAGFDVFGDGNWDLTLGLWLGTAGEWDRNQDRAVLYAAPMAGTEVGLGVQGEHLFAKYRWLAGIGAGPVDDLLTEQELTIGYKILPQFHAYGQYFVLSPGQHDNRSGVGIGGRVVF